MSMNLSVQGVAMAAPGTSQSVGCLPNGSEACSWRSGKGPFAERQRAVRNVVRAKRTQHTPLGGDCVPFALLSRQASSRRSGRGAVFEACARGFSTSTSCAT